RSCAVSCARSPRTSREVSATPRHWPIPPWSTIWSNTARTRKVRLNSSANLLNHHCRRAVLWGSAFLLSFLNSCIVQAQQPSRLSDRGDEITFFYKDPKAERLVGVFTSLRDQSLPWNAYPPVAGLFARIFILHPDWLERLVLGAPDA